MKQSTTHARGQSPYSKQWPNMHSHGQKLTFASNELSASRGSTSISSSLTLRKGALLSFTSHTTEKQTENAFKQKCITKQSWQYGCVELPTVGTENLPLLTDNLIIIILKNVFDKMCFTSFKTCPPDKNVILFEDLV